MHCASPARVLRNALTGMDTTEGTAGAEPEPNRSLPVVGHEITVKSDPELMIPLGGGSFAWPRGACTSPQTSISGSMSQAINGNRL